MRPPEDRARDEAAVDALLARKVGRDEILVEVLVEVVGELSRRLLALEARP